jgi:hypothetical protein
VDIGVERLGGCAMTTLTPERVAELREQYDDRQVWDARIPSDELRCLLDVWVAANDPKRIDRATEALWDYAGGEPFPVVVISTEEDARYVAQRVLDAADNKALGGGDREVTKTVVKRCEDCNPQGYPEKDCPDRGGGYCGFRKALGGGR